MQLPMIQVDVVPLHDILAATQRLGAPHREHDRPKMRISRELGSDFA